MGQLIGHLIDHIPGERFRDKKIDAFGHCAVPVGNSVISRDHYQFCFREFLFDGVDKVDAHSIRQMVVKKNDLGILFVERMFSFPD